MPLESIFAEQTPSNLYTAAAGGIRDAQAYAFNEDELIQNAIKSRMDEELFQKQRAMTPHQVSREEGLAMQALGEGWVKSQQDWRLGEVGEQKGKGQTALATGAYDEAINPSKIKFAQTEFAGKQADQEQQNLLDAAIDLDDSASPEQATAHFASRGIDPNNPNVQGYANTTPQNRKLARTNLQKRMEARVAADPKTIAKKQEADWKGKWDVIVQQEKNKATMQAAELAERGADARTFAQFLASQTKIATSMRSSATAVLKQEMVGDGIMSDQVLENQFKVEHPELVKKDLNITKATTKNELRKFIENKRLVRRNAYFESVTSHEQYVQDLGSAVVMKAGPERDKEIQRVNREYIAKTRKEVEDSSKKDKTVPNAPAASENKKIATEEDIENNIKKYRLSRGEVISKLKGLGYEIKGN